MTYTVGKKGAVSGNEWPNNAVQSRGYVLPDTTVNSNTSSATTTQCAAVTGGIHGIRAQGGQVLCQMPDGQLRWCVFDPYNSTADFPVMLPVGP